MLKKNKIIIICLIIIYLLNVFDLCMTNYWVKTYGIEIESNPIGRWLYENNLTIQVKIFGIGVLILLLYFLLKKKPAWAWTSWLILVIYVILAIYHIYILIVLN